MRAIKQQSNQQEILKEEEEYIFSFSHASYTHIASKQSHLQSHTHLLIHTLPR